MSILDQVTQMKSEGKQDQEIISALQNQGIPPKEIQDAVSQAQIKNAVIGSQTADMEQSIMDTTPQEYQEPIQEAVQAPAQVPEYAPQEYTQQEYPQQEYTQDYYDQGYGYAQPSDTGTLVEIAEQVFADKVRKIQRQLDSLTEFKTLSETRLNNVEERLKRIEEMFDKLQLAILDKVGTFGKNLTSVKKEMTMMQDSFGKVINPLLDKKRHRK